MWKHSSMVLGLSVFVLVGCGTKSGNNVSAIKDVPGVPSTMNAQEAGDTSYRYAFSGQILNALTGQAIKNFTVQPAATDNAVGTIVNALGDSNGVFHISRTPSAADAVTKILPLLVSAPGFEPVVTNVEVGADGTANKPMSFLMKAISSFAPAVLPAVTGGVPAASVLSQVLPAVTGATGSNVAAPANIAGVVSSLLGSQSGLNPSAITSLINTKGATNIFQGLVGTGKIDSSLAGLLGGAKSGDVLSNVLVLLNGATGTAGGVPNTNQIAGIVSGLLGGVPAGNLQGLGNANIAGLAQQIIPLLAAGSPQVGGAMVAVNMLLPYLQPLVGQISGGNSSQLGNILGAFLGQSGGNPTGGIANLAQLLAGGTGGTGGAQLAMTTLLPLVQSFLGGQGGVATGSQNPFAGVLGQLLGGGTTGGAGSLLGLLGGIGGVGNVSNNAQATQLLAMLAPLIQGLSGSNATGLASMFNALVKQGGITGLKDFPAGLGQLDQFAQLAPFLDPLVKGLNSQDASSIATMLQPLLAKKNPASAVQGLLSKAGKGGTGNLLSTLTSLFPALPTVVNQSVPAKQVLSAQLLQGLLNGDFKGLSVVKDLAGSQGVLVQGQALDILKLAQLPNVDKLVAVGGQ